MKITLVLEAVVFGLPAYLAFRNHTVFYRDAEIFEDVLFYSAAVVVAAVVLAVAEVLSGEDR